LSSRALRNGLFAIAGAVALMAFVSSASAAVQFGVRCQSSFQDTWAPTIDVDTACSDFISEIQPSDPVDFYFNLHGAELAFYSGQAAETCNSCGGVDSVDFFFMMTHGTIANNNVDFAGYAMWDDSCSGTNPPGCIAWTPNMRLGDSGQQLKALATFSCDTFENSDGNFWNRWSKAFSGGLKVGVGGEALLYTGNDSQAATNFASYMLGNTTIGSSWLEGVYYANNSNTPTVANTGSNSSNCWSRQGVTLGNVISESVLRDSQIGYVCWTNWN
jgi:hypothetical protein